MSQYDLDPNMASHPRDVLPASQYLQERLQERRARNTRPKRSRHTDFGPQKGRDDDIFINEAEDTRRTRMYDSSPLAAPSTRSSDAGSVQRRRPPGVRDMDTQLDRLNKQNFALKLELDHRREHTKKLQDEIEAMRAMVERAALVEEEHKELLRINSQMVDELERRDKAVEEAMDIICELEERVADAEERNSHTRPSTAHADSGYAGTESQDNDLTSSPPQPLTKTPHIKVRSPSQPASAASKRLQGVLSAQTPAKSRKEPSCLSQKRPSTNALRSVYLENAKSLHPVKSFQSLLSRQEARVEDEEGPSSPRLSVLSESSFPSLYSPKKTSPDRYAWENADEDGSHSHLRQDSIKRVSQWISERDAVELTPSKSNSLSSPMAAEDEDLDHAHRRTRHDSADSHYQSLNDALVSVTGRSSQQEEMNLFDPRARKQRSTQSRPTSFAGPIFGEPLLPPTPDSASTRMLRASRSSIADDRNFLDIDPAGMKGFGKPPLPIEPGLRTAPRQMRSSVELRTALASNMEFRSEVLDSLRATDTFVNGVTAFEADGRSSIGGYPFEDDDFPDGKSIHMGTPRRLLKRAKPQVSSHLAQVESAEEDLYTSHPPPQRRRSSDHHQAGTTKPRLTRVETSPVAMQTLGGRAHSGKKLSVERMTSPHSVHSNSSGNRTIVQAEEPQRRAMSPEGLTAIPQPEPGYTSPLRPRLSPTPGRTLSQKTATLFRRLSNSHGSDREKAPLSALSTSFNGAPAELKRPRTSMGHERPPTSGGNAAGARPPSSRGDTRRPSLQSRTKTEPSAARPPSSATDRSLQGSEKDKRSFFKRANSVKKPDSTDEVTGKAGSTKRRGSLRDAVTTARRPWR